MKIFRFQVPHIYFRYLVNICFHISYQTSMSSVHAKLFLLSIQRFQPLKKRKYMVHNGKRKICILEWHICPISLMAIIVGGNCFKRIKTMGELIEYLVNTSQY